MRAGTLINGMIGCMQHSPFSSPYMVLLGDLLEAIRAQKVEESLNSYGEHIILSFLS